MDARPPGLTRRTLLAGGATLAGMCTLGACGARLAGTEDSGGPPEGDITLLTPIFDGREGKQLLEETLLPQFTARYPKVTVSVDYLTGYDYLNEKITTGLTTGIPSDVIMLGVGWVEPFASRQVLSELTSPPGGLAEYSEQILSACRWGGKLYALPVVLDTRFGICRTDLLAQAGLSRPPTSMDELRQYAIRLTQRRDGVLTRTGLDVLSADPRQVFETVLFAFGGELFRAGRPAFNDPVGVAALQWLADLQLRDGVIDAGFSNTKAVSVPIGDGRAAMCIGHNNWWVTTKKQHPESLPHRVGRVPPPVRRAGPGGLHRQSAGISGRCAAEGKRAGTGLAAGHRLRPGQPTGPVRSGQPAVRARRGWRRGLVDDPRRHQDRRAVRHERPSERPAGARPARRQRRDRDSRLRAGELNQ